MTPRHYTMPVRSGDRVACLVDLRHEGLVVAVFNSLVVQVRWCESGWLSEHHPRELTVLEPS